MEAAEKISITLTAEMARMIREEVEKGRYASTSEAIRDALRLWQQRKEEHESRLESIRQRVEASINDPRPGLTSEEVRTRLYDLHERTVAKKKHG
jgi:antitoxin ParD1/3/4